MIWMRIALAALAGLALGWIAWLAARWWITRRSTLADTHGFVILTDTWVPVIAMTLWGGYVGWRGLGLATTSSALVSTALFLSIALVERQTRLIPDEFVVAVVGWAIVQSLWLKHPDPTMAALGLATAGAVFWLLRWLGRYWFGRDALGLGDVKLAAGLGALVGLPAVLASMLAGIIAGGVVAAFLLLTGRAGRRDAFAYGPYLALGAWLVLTLQWGLWPGWTAVRSLSALFQTGA